MALTGKQALFVEEYLRSFNVTGAALAAGYSPKTAYSIGSENLKKPEIAEAISQRFSQAAMPANEVLARLADHARGNMADFWDIPELDENGIPDGKPSLNLASPKAKSQLNLIKKLKVKTTTRAIAGIPDLSETTTEVDFELYDAQSALEKLGRHHKLFTDRQEIDLNVDFTKLSDEELQRIIEG